MDTLIPAFAVIGSGHRGINHIKNAHKLLSSKLKYVCYIPKSAKRKLRKAVINIAFTTDISIILNDKDVNAVIISTPAETHFSLPQKTLKAGKHDLVEKPIALNAKDTKELIKFAEKKHLKLMVSHILLYHPSILSIKEMIKSGKLGKLQYIYSIRLNLGSNRKDENILWSFSLHDISVLKYHTESYPMKINTTGASFVQKKIEDTSLTTLEYLLNIHAHIFVSWLHPFKYQRLVAIGTKGMLTFEDTLKSEKLKY